MNLRRLVQTPFRDQVSEDDADVRAGSPRQQAAQVSPPWWGTAIPLAHLRNGFTVRTR
jgi:hypothetical protein